MKTLKIPALVLALTAFGVFAAGCNGDDDTPDGGGGNPDAITGGMDARLDAMTPDMGFADADPVDTGVDSGVVGEAFVARLSGAEENPSVATAATGSADLVLAPSGMLSYSITLNGLPNPVAAHIHVGPAGQNGPVAHPLDQNALMGSVLLTAAQQADLNAGRLYINFHTAANPGGEIRGQILRPGERLFVARLSSAEEVPTNTSTASGSVSVIINAANNSIHYDMVHNANATAAHLHRGAAGVNGPVVIPLDMDGTGDAAVTAAQVAAIVQGLWYANVHTAANPGGEIRGQLIEPGAQLFVANLTGAQEVPPVVTVATGRAQVIRSYDGTELKYWVTSNATVAASHIHAAPGGNNGPVLIPLSAFAGGVTQGTAVTTATGTAGLVRGTWYVNIHTAANPGGEIRGQLLSIGEILYTAILAGTNEVPPNNSNGTGGFGLILNGNIARGDGRVSGLSGAIVAAHIHDGVVAMNGPVRQALDVDGTDLSLDNLMLTPADLTALNMAGWYVNVHTAMFPGGEIRGQLERK